MSHEIESQVCHGFHESLSLSISLPLCCRTTLNNFRILLDWIEPDGLGSYGFGPYGFGPYGLGPEGLGPD